MGLKTRHIMQNIKQIKKELSIEVDSGIKPYNAYAEKWDKTIDKIYWETNSLIKRHPNIDPAKIIAKTSTHEFPADAITVRFRSQATREVVVYFYGEKKTRNAYSYIKEKLRVTLPFSRRTWSYGFSFQGELPSNMDMESLKIALDYITAIIEEIK